MKLSRIALAASVTLCLGAAPLFGASSALAATTSLPNHFSRLILLDTQANKDEYIAIYGDLGGKRFDDLASAEKSASSDYFDLPHLSTTEGTISSLEGGEYLTADADAKTVEYSDSSITDPALQWDVDAAGHAKSGLGGFLAFDDASKHLNLSANGRFVLVGSSTGVAPTTIVATLDKYDSTTGAALIKGSAASSAFAEVHISWAEGNFTSTQSDGTFIAGISGIEPGQKEIVLTQTVDGTKFDSFAVPLSDDGGENNTPFALTSPKAGDTFAPNTTGTFTGTGEPGETVTLHTTNYASADVTTTVKTDKTWSIDRYLGGGTYVFDITQSNDPGTGVKNFTYAPKPVVVGDLKLTSPKAGDTFAPNTTGTFTGTGEPGETVTLHTTNYASADVTTTVKTDKTWSIDRYLGGGTYVFDITQSNDPGTGVKNFTYAPKPVVVGDLKLTSPKAGDTFAPNTTGTFTGTGEPGETVTLHTTNYASADVTTTVKTDKTWSIDRYLGGGTYVFDITQSNDPGTGVKNFTYAPKPVVVGDLKLTSPKAGDTFAPNTTGTFTGTGEPGETVTLHTTNYASADVTTTVKTDTTWSIDRYLGGGTYVFDITQSNDPGTGVKNFTYAPKP